jgi:hypothetical protein
MENGCASKWDACLLRVPVRNLPKMGDQHIGGVCETSFYRELKS